MEIPGEILGHGGLPRAAPAAMASPRHLFFSIEVQRSCRRTQDRRLVASGRMRSALARLCEELEHLLIERWDIVGLSARHKAAVDHECRAPSMTGINSCDFRDYPAWDARAGYAKAEREF